MDEKKVIKSAEEGPSRPPPSPVASTSPGTALKAFCAGILLALLTSYAVLNNYGITFGDVFTPYTSALYNDIPVMPTLRRPCGHSLAKPASGKVALEAHIM